MNQKRKIFEKNQFQINDRKIKIKHLKVYIETRQKEIYTMKDITKNLENIYKEMEEKKDSNQRYSIEKISVISIYMKCTKKPHLF